VQADYLDEIKRRMSDVLVKDPITELNLTPNMEKQTTAVSFNLNLSQAVEKADLESALGGAFTLEEVTMGGDGKTASVRAVYPRGTNLSRTGMQTIITSQIENAAEAGSPVALLDPFPSTGYIGPTVGHQLRDAAIISIFFSLVAIIVYIRLRFKEYKYGIAAAAALVHDVLITLGAVTAARMAGIVDVQIDLPLIAAFLTIIGYSLNDTIVVFDRVRENLPRMNLPFKELLNVSINQTLSRTILTSLTTLLALVLLFGLNYGQRNVLEGFSFAMIVGVLVGTYSSIFVASPVLLWLNLREAKAEGVKAATPKKKLETAKK
jgi:preprotein translocase SecF subunit